MVVLRDGSYVSDIRLDRLKEFDDRSRQHGIRQVVRTTAPLKTRHHVSSIWLDQGQEGACVSFALHHLLGTSPYTVRGMTDALARERYFEIQKGDPWPGGAYAGADPFYEGTSVLSGVKYLQSIGLIAAYKWAFNIDEVLVALSHEGPNIFGLSWLDSMSDPDPLGMLDTSGEEDGGHAIMGRSIHVPRSGVVETIGAVSKKRIRIKTTEPLVRLRNSWSTDWGLDGECFVSASQLERLLDMEGEACVPMKKLR